MEHIFLNIDYTNFQQLLVKILVFFLIAGILLYGSYFILSKALFRKSKERKELNLRLVYHWAIFACFILFNVYLFVFLYIKGTESLQWTNPKFYLGITPHLLLYLGLIIYFFIKRNILKKIINNNSIN
ncbi:MAG: hypothetical protein LBT50_01265 [Prevotellaceae bacterium]|jgi:archaellum biogenesis protein FlaJ (TadC family)|nr:hypothetical protein [Prevotellaceae bacterium]